MKISPDGTIEQTNIDGTIIQLLTNKTKIQKNVDGSVIKIFPDGTRIQSYPNGKEMKIDRNGTITLLAEGESLLFQLPGFVLMRPFRNQR